MDAKLIKYSASLLLGILLLWGLYIYGEINFIVVIDLVEFPLLINVILLKLVVMLLLSYRWVTVLHSYSINQRFYDSFRYTLIGHSLMTIFPGVVAQDVAKIGGVIRTSSSKCKVKDIVTLSVIDRLIGIYALFISAFFIIVASLIYNLFNDHHNVLAGFFCYVTTISLVIIFSPVLMAFIVKFYSFHFKSHNWLNRKLLIIKSIRQISISKYTVFELIAVSVLSHLLNAFIVVIIANNFSLEVGILTNIMFGIISNLGNIIPLTPGGLGSTEIIFSYLYSLMDNSDGAEIGLSYRILGYISIFVLTLFISLCHLKFKYSETK